MARVFGPLPIFHYPEDSFKLEVTPTDDYKFVLPLPDDGTYDFTLDWGDGSEVKTITAYDSADRIHTYADATPRTITIIGQCTKLDTDVAAYPTTMWELDTSYVVDDYVEIMFGNKYTCILEHTSTADDEPGSGINWETYWVLGTPTDNTKNMVTAVGTVSGDIGLTNLKLTSCTNLTTISATMKNLKSLTTANGMFSSCSSLTTIGTGIFDGSTGINDCEAVFGYCSALTTIPTDLFKYNTAVTTFAQAFRGTAITAIPVELFRYCPVTNFTQCFSECTALTSIPNYLFRYNTAATAFSSVFQGCTQAQINPYIFWGEGERDTRFHDKSIHMEVCFHRTSYTGAQGTAPDVWACDYGTGSNNPHYYCFGTNEGTDGLSNMADIPGDWKHA